MRLIEVPDEVALQYEALARAAGTDSAGLIREALLLRLEEIDDEAVARARLAAPARRVRLEDVERELGLDD